MTALALVMMLALGAAFLSHTTEYAPEIFALLFGEVLGVSVTEILPVAGARRRLPRRGRLAVPPAAARRRSCPRWPKPGACVPTAWRLGFLVRPGARHRHDRARWWAPC